MNKIISIHSFRRGVGKSSLTANLAALLALQGRRVALVDTDFQAPSAHLFFGLSDGEIAHTLNGYLWDRCDILSTVRDVTTQIGAEAVGKLFLVPASTQVVDVMQMLRTPLNIDRYTDGLEKLGRELALDILLVDTPAGLNEDTLSTIAVSNALVLVLHPDKQDFQGIAVTVDVAHRLQVPAIHLVLNDAAETLNVQDARLQLEQTYHCGGGTVLSHTEELMVLASSRPFVLCYPQHPLTALIKELAERL
jgi:MinD-like ATPase involved in chromosome partitioning or flagellar assembly